MEIESATPIQLAQHKAWKDAHNRLLVANHAAGPIEKPIEAPIPIRTINIVPADPTKDLIEFIIAAVGNVAGLPVNEIASGPPLPEITSARNLAMALCVWRLKLDTKTIAEYFEVLPESVTDAAKALRPTLRDFSISGKTPLEMTLPTIWGHWKAPALVSIASVQRATCETWGIDKIELLAHRQTREVVTPRQAAMAIAKKLTLKSLPEIGRKFDRRDHTTVLHAVRKFAPVISAVSLKLSPSSTVYEWAQAVRAELEITLLAKGRRGDKRAHEQDQASD